jgi:hypothetical protein
MLLEFTLSSQARMPNWLLLRQLYSGGDSGVVLSGNVVVQAMPTVQRSFGAFRIDTVAHFGYVVRVFAFDLVSLSGCMIIDLYRHEFHGTMSTVTVSCVERPAFKMMTSRQFAVLL